MRELQDCRRAFAATLLELARSDDRVVAVANDSVGSTMLTGFGKEFPDRLINVGIAEQNMVGIAAGLANSGRVPFVCAASCFLTARALEQIKVDVCYSNRKVILCAMSGGLAYGALGATHHSIEDVAWTRAVANLNVVVPADPTETAQALRAAYEQDRPTFLRLSRMPVPEVHDASYQFRLGRAAVLRDGNELTLIANGVMVARALEAAAGLASQGIQARVVNMATVKPIDDEVVSAAATETGGIVTIEEHTVYGGLGSAVAEVVVLTAPRRMRILGVPGVFAPTGSEEFLLDHFGLNPRGIEDAALELLQVSSRR